MDQKSMNGIGFASPRRMFTGAVRSLLDVLFPPQCLSCRCYPENFVGAFCPTCADQIARERVEPCCPACAESVGPFEVAEGRCGHCRDVRLRIAGVVRVGRYRDSLAELVKAYKYWGREELEPVMVDWLVAVIETAPWRNDVEGIVAVPTHWKHRIRRPLYPAEALARCVAKRLDLPLLPILRRVRAGPHQVGLSATQRATNIRGAFALRKGVHLENARLLLIDDVRTTGATLEECAKILLQGGASEIHAAILAKVFWGDFAGHSRPSV